MGYTAAMFELRNVHKTFGAKAVIRGVSLHVHSGKTTALIGPSGCGKSTCLRLMLGLIQPDSGEARFDGMPIDRAYLPQLRRRVGYVIQDGGLFPHMTARQNVTIMARATGMDSAALDARLDALTALTNFPRDGLARYPVELSGGQRQRVALMRALMLDPEALLLDEPLGALDPMIRFELQTELREIFHALGKTVVIVTHDLAEADYFSHEIVLMRGGAIVQRGTLDEMNEAPADDFVARFIRAQRGHARGARKGSAA